MPIIGNMIEPRWGTNDRQAIAGFRPGNFHPIRGFAILDCLIRAAQTFRVIAYIKWFE